jgi:hypothetical protein
MLRIAVLYELSGQATVQATNELIHGSVGLFQL